MNKLLTILGPTATGKTDLAIDLAKKFNGELISADSRQVYIGLDIGTGKMPGNGQLRIDNGQLKKGKGFWKIGGIKIWMYDVVNPQKQYNVARFVRDAQKVIEDVIKRGKLPILVGGTGLYIKALIEGIPTLAIPFDAKLRSKLTTFSLDKLQEKLHKLSIAKWQSLNESDRKNPRRLVRAIEIITMQPHKKNVNLKLVSYNILKVGLTAKREVLYQRIDEKVVSRIKQGMIDEAGKLYSQGLTLKRMKQLGLEYGVLADYLKGKIQTIDELIKILQGRIHAFVRRQLTWFKKEKNVNWFDITNLDYSNKIEKLVRSWYDSS